MVKRIILLLFVLSYFHIAFAQTAKVNATTDTSDYLVGDPIKFTIKVDVAKNYLVIPPAIKDTIAGLEVLSQSKTETEESANNKVITFNYLLAGYDSLQVEIEPIEIQIHDKSDSVKFTVFSNPVLLNVNKVAIDTTKDIKDVKAPIKIPLDWKVVALWILAIALLAGLAFYLFRKYRKKKAGEAEPEEIIVLPPDIIALKSLNELDQKKLWQNGKVKEYHTEITGIVRKYFEGRFNFPALELTTTEVMDKLDGIRSGKKIKDITSGFLNNADLVKFAKYKPMNEINEEMMKQAYTIVEETKSTQKPAVELSDVQ